MTNGVTLPPVVVFADGSDYWLADGFHRLAATREAGRSTIEADVWLGGRREALLFAVGANSSHGLRRTNADKRRAVELLLHDAEWGRWSDREIARRCGVSDMLVADIRRSLQELEVSAPVERTYTTKHGTVGTMRTESIGRSAAPLTPAPAPPRMSSPTLPPPMAVHFSSDTPEHYTPAIVLGAVVDCLGVIDLDPCSNGGDAPNVPAGKHYTASDDGLSHPWAGRVYLNPPYGREIDRWVEKLCREYQHGEVTEALALLPARTDTQWFRRLRNYACCFVTGRLTFIGNDDPAPFPSAVFYLGDDLGKFYHWFEGLGDVWQRVEPGMFAE